MIRSSQPALRAGEAFVKRLARALMHRIASGEALPSAQGNVDIDRVELETEADPAAHLGGDQGRSRAEKWIIDRLAGPAVIGDRPAHALDRLLRAVPGAFFALPIAKRIVVGDLPHGGLFPATLPSAGFAVAHRVPAGFVL